VKLEDVYNNEDGAFAVLQVACGAMPGPNWWGTGNEPLAFTVSHGDCARFNDRFHCVTEITVRKAVTLQSTYRVNGGDVLRRVP
jgi:hypothetical protein